MSDAGRMEAGIKGIAAVVEQLLPRSRACVAIDGPDGSGKTTFSAHLAACFACRPVIVLHADDFLNPSEVRHARGRHSPEGFWLDSYDYDRFRIDALEPLGGRGNGWYRSACYDPVVDATVRSEARLAPSDAIVLVEGLFLHRDELVNYWDVSVFLDVPFRETARRMAKRDGSHPDPEHESMRRYVEGQRIYYRLVKPWERASLFVDNSGEEPVVLREP